MLWVRRALVERPAELAGEVVGADHLVFSSDVPGVDPSHLDSMSNAFRALRRAVGAAEEVHLHSLRQLRATVLDAVISGAQTSDCQAEAACRRRIEFMVGALGGRPGEPRWLVSAVGKYVRVWSQAGGAPIGWDVSSLHRLGAAESNPWAFDTDSRPK